MDAPSKIRWRRIAFIEFWLCFLPPVGFWMLWREPTLTRTAKLRMVTYTFLIPFLVYLAVGLFLVNRTEHAIQAGGGGF